MRVIAGRLKGRRLAAPRGTSVRPTSDRLRGTLFNVIAARVPGARVLDGFAGTGALGIEALSRGAAEVTFVESDRHAAGVLAENLQRCGIEDGYVMMRAAFHDALGRLPLDRRFDLIFLDPPYAMANVDGILNAAATRLARAGLLVLEHSRRRQAPPKLADIERVREVVAGDSALAFYARPERLAADDQRGDPVAVDENA